jgi:hypothetical protein
MAINIIICDFRDLLTRFLLLEIVIFISFSELENANRLFTKLGLLEDSCPNLGLPITQDFLPLGLHFFVRQWHRTINLADINSLLELILSCLLANRHIAHF